LVRADGPDLYVTLYLPEAEPRASGVSRSIAICPPIGEEQGLARSILHRIAARLARLGHRVVMYDPQGHGDSDGDIENLTLTDLTSDLASAAKHPDLGAPADTVIALRFGATVAAHALAHGRVDPRKLILIAPVLLGAPYAASLLRKNVASQITNYGAQRRPIAALESALMRGERVDVDGHAFAAPLYASIRTADPITLLAHAPRARLDIITLHPRGRALVSPDVEALTHRRPDATHHCVVEAEPWKDDRRVAPGAAPALTEAIVAALADDEVEGDTERMVRHA